MFSSTSKVWVDKCVCCKTVVKGKGCKKIYK